MRQIFLISVAKFRIKQSKGRSNVFMFVGLQGSGKTTSCTKVCSSADHYLNCGISAHARLAGVLLSTKGMENMSGLR
jgi:septin family protein